MTDRELFMKVLDALEWNLPVIQDYGDKEQLNIQHNAIIALREKMGFYGYKPTLLKTANELKPEQEPVPMWELQEDGWNTICDGDWLETLPVGTKLYTTPPHRKPLTDEEMRECAKAMDAEPLVGGWLELIKFARAIEAAHGIKP